MTMNRYNGRLFASMMAMATIAANAIKNAAIKAEKPVPHFDMDASATKWMRSELTRYKVPQSWRAQASKRTKARFRRYSR